MTFADLAPLLPLIVLAFSAVIAMLAIATQRGHGTTLSLTVAGFLAALFTLPVLIDQDEPQFLAMLSMDNTSLYYLGLVIKLSLLVTLIGYGYFKKHGEQPEEFYLLLTVSTFGAGILVAATHFTSFFLGLEILSVALYGMVAYKRDDRRSLEAGLKYLVLASGSAAFLLFGMALIYAESGSMEFAAIGAWAAQHGASSIVFVAGLGMAVVGIGFKLAVVPFHLWTPDVYEGAPAPTTAYVATVSKGAIFALLLRYFAEIDVHAYPAIATVFTLMAIASMFVGNLLALLQTNVKRLLAYSSIANLGYLLVAFLSGGDSGNVAAAFYLTAYCLTVLGAFGVVAMLSGNERDADRVSDYQGLYWTRPALAAAFTVMLLSLAGIPLTAGFIGKFFVLAAGEQSANWLLVFSLVINSAIGIYYYLRIIIAMGKAPTESPAHLTVSLPWTGAIAVGAASLAVIVLGVFPAPLLDMVQYLIVAH